MSECSAQWSNTTNQFYDSLHMAVCTDVNTQQHPIVVKSYPDDGYFIIWEDGRNTATTKMDIYAQKFDHDGVRLWAANGVPVANGPNEQHFTYSSNEDYRNLPVAATDSAGGFYLTYIDDSIATYNWQRICVQHLKNDGNLVFPGAGYIIAQTPSGQSYNFSAPQLIADDDRGFYIAYSMNSNEDFIYIYCYKDEAGTMKLHGGGRVNENALQTQESMPCVGANRWSVIYPGTNVFSYNIWPDLQGGCSIIMSMNGNNGQQYKILAYNKVWKAKKPSQVMVRTRFPTGDPDSFTVNYSAGDVDILYKLNTNLLNGSCTSNVGHYFWVDQILLSNGYLVLGQGGYDYNYPKGTAISTTGNINVELIACTNRSISGNTVSNFYVESTAWADEKYDSVPYQRASNNNPDIGYNPIAPSQLNKFNGLRDTLLAPGIYYPDFSLASGGGQIYCSGLVGLNIAERDVRLQHLSVDRESADSFAIHYKTGSNKGELIGKELNTGFGTTQISYDLPLVTVNNTGNALFYIREYERYIRVSPIVNGAELAWGAMGKPIGTPIFNGTYYYPDLAYARLDPLDGTGVISWQDLRNLPANTGTNIFMRHLDSLNVVDYMPLNKSTQLLAGGSTTANPAVLLGTSKKYSTIEAYNNITGTTSPVLEVLDTYNLGAVSANIFQNTGLIRTYNGKPYLDRNYTIKPENNPNGAASISLRLFFTATEFDALKAADPGIINPGSLVVIKQPNNTASVPVAYTPAAGEEVVLPASWKAVPGGYYLEISITGFSNFFIQKGSAVLPVRWIGVQAAWQNVTQAKVSWQVADQLNVKDYTVQHSEDGATYTNVCTVTYSAMTGYYDCVVPANSNGKNYYKVLQQDVDGRSSYSKVVVLQSSTKPSLRAYPNPAKDKLYIDGLDGYHIVRIIDASGKIIQQQNVLAGLKYIDIRRLNAGVYLLTATNDMGTQTVRFSRN
jgi:hypothetical protein